MLGDERIIQKCRREFQGANMTPLLEQCVSITSSHGIIQFVMFYLIPRKSLNAFSMN